MHAVSYLVPEYCRQSRMIQSVLLYWLLSLSPSLNRQYCVVCCCLFSKRNSLNATKSIQHVENGLHKMMLEALQQYTIEMLFIQRDTRIVNQDNQQQT
jgi:hypothetical protein